MNIILKKIIKSYKYIGKSEIYFLETETKIKKFFSSREKNIMANNKVVIHKHNYSINLNNDLKNIIPVSHHDNKYITSFEFKDYPFYGTLFHPELAIKNKEKNKKRLFSLYLKKFRVIFY